MTTIGAIPSLFLAMAMVSNGSMAMADTPATKPATQPTPTAKPQPSYDPFEQPSTPTKPGTRPNAPAEPLATAPAATPVENLPSKELEAFMKGFEGSWKCDTKFAAGAMGPGSQAQRARTEMSIKKEFGGFSWHGEFKLTKTTTTSATSGVFQIGYATGTKQATFLSYDSVGSAMMGAGTISGDSVTFAEEGFLKGVKVKIRETLAAKGPKRLYHKVEIEQGKGYQPMAEDTCVK